MKNTAGIARNRSRLRIKIEVIADEQIEPTVAIIIKEGTTRAPANLPLVKPGLLCYVRKGAVAVVLIEDIVPPIGHKEIVHPIVVVISDANALSPATPNKPRFDSYIRKCSVAIVSQ